MGPQVVVPQHEIFVRCIHQRGELRERSRLLPRRIEEHVVTAEEQHVDLFVAQPLERVPRKRERSGRA